ncbi:MAG: hypothetical protein WBQ14_03595 [Gaiellaceae bacterium]
MAEMTEFRCEVGVVLSSAASAEEMAIMSETALERLLTSDSAQELASGFVVSANLERPSIDVDFTIEAVSEAEAYRKLGLLLPALTEALPSVEEKAAGWSHLRRIELAAV